MRPRPVCLLLAYAAFTLGGNGRTIVNFLFAILLSFSACRRDSPRYADILLQIYCAIACIYTHIEAERRPSLPQAVTKSIFSLVNNLRNYFSFLA